MSKAISAMQAMWAFASQLVEKHGMDGDDTMTDAEHQEWQEAAAACHVALSEQQELEQGANRAPTD